MGSLHVREDVAFCDEQGQLAGGTCPATIDPIFDF